MGGGDQGCTIKLEKPQNAVSETGMQGEEGRSTGMKIKSQMRSSGNEEPINVW